MLDTFTHLRQRYAGLPPDNLDDEDDRKLLNIVRTDCLNFSCVPFGRGQSLEEWFQHQQCRLDFKGGKGTFKFTNDLPPPKKKKNPCFYFEQNVGVCVL